MKAQNLSRLPVQRRTVILDIVDIDTNTHFFLIRRRLLIADVAEKPLEVSANIGSPQVKEGASISSILCSGTGRQGTDRASLAEPFSLAG